MVKFAKCSLIIIILIILLIVAFFEGMKFGFSEEYASVSHDNAGYNELKYDFFNTDRTNIQEEYYFSNGIVLNDVDVYKASYDLINAAFSQKWEDSPLVISTELFSKLYPDPDYTNTKCEFAFSITEIDHYENKAVVAYIYEFKIINKKTKEVGNIGRAPQGCDDKIYLEYIDNEWHVTGFNRLP